jgi:hypothetical protein
MSEAFCPNEFWNYNYCNEIELDPKVLSGIKFKGKLLEEIENLYSTYLKSAVHPCLKKIIKEIDEEENDENKSNIEEEGTIKEDEKKVNIKELIFNAIRIDQNTIKFMFLLLDKTKIVSLKLSNNNLTLKNFNLLINDLIYTSNNIYSFRFEWNDFLINEENNNQKMIFNEMDLSQPIQSEINFMKHLKLLFSPEIKENKLESISFRGCFLGNQLMNELLPLIKDNQNLLILNLYKNNLSNEILPSLSNMFLFNRKLKEINLGGNFFDDKTITHLKSYIGAYELSQEEYEKILKLIEERNNIIENNKKMNKSTKNKSAPKEVPFVDEIKEKIISEENVKHYIIKNDTIEKIDFMNNPNMTQKSFNDLLYLIDHTTNLILYLDLRKYDKDSVLKMIDINGPYSNRIYLYK